MHNSSNESGIGFISYLANDSLNTLKGYVMKKTKVANAVESTLDNLAIVSAIGVNLGKINKLDGEINVLKEDINQKIIVLFGRKVVIGRYSKEGATKGCAYACAFVDVCVQSGIEQSTAQRVYLPTFKDAVATGKPITDWNGSRATSNTVLKSKVEFSSKLLKVFNDAEFDGFVYDLQKSYHNDEIKTFKEGIVSYLEMMGEDISKKK